MRNETRILFNSFVSQIALLNGVDNASVHFSVDPAVEQRVEEKIKESSEFLQLINTVPVIDQKGEKVGIEAVGTIAGRTNTANNTRIHPVDPTDTVDDGGYFCELTEYNWSRKYALLDAWRHKPNFETLVRDAILKQQGRDRIMIGWNGTSAAAQTDRVANPLLQDVNIGWLHKIRTFAPARVLNDGDLTVNPLKAIYVHEDGDVEGVGQNADYKTLDALVYDAKMLIDEWYRDDTELVVIVGSDLVHDKYFPIVQKAGNTATEIQAMENIIRSSKQMGGFPAVRVPFFPANALMITRLDNLSVYVQEGNRRRMLKDEPEYKRVANYESVNEAYVVEEYGMVALVENIVLGLKP